MAGAYVSTTYVSKEVKQAKQSTPEASLQGKWRPVGYTATRFQSLEFRENFIILTLHNQGDPDIRRFIQDRVDKKLIIDERFGEDTVMSYELDGDELKLKAPGVGQTLQWKRGR